MPRALLWLLLAVPVAIILAGLAVNPAAVFVVAAIGLIPLAGLISSATEKIAERTGERIGGLLNATFGNAAELIIGFSALGAGLPDVVRASISGSIIGNALLVLGSAMFVGGWRHGDQRFDARSAGQYATMLALAVVGLVIPSILITVGQSGATTAPHVSRQAEYPLSFVVAAVLLLVYLAYIAFTVFQVHARGAAWAPTIALSEAGDPSPVPAHQPSGQGAGKRVPSSEPYSKRPSPGGMLVRLRRLWETNLAVQCGVLAGTTALTAVVSEILVSAIEPVSHNLGLSTFFVGLIVLPIVGNAAEHSSAITAARSNRMETAMAITAGSSIQVALLVAPVLVLLSPAFGADFTLSFTGLELVIFALVAFIFALVSLDGESTWLEGIQLFAFYLIVAAAAFFIPGGR